MASISRDKNGTKRIMFSDVSGKRQTIRMGKLNVKTAEAFVVRLDRLIASSKTGTPVDALTNQWLAELPEGVYAKLVKVELVQPRQVTASHTLGVLLEEYFETMSVKDSTRIRYSQTKRILLEYFGQDRTLESITPRDADKYRVWLVGKEYATAKISKEIQIARMFFKRAVRWEMIPSNPFEGVRGGAQTNRDRMTYVTPEIAHKLIETAPSADWRCIIALARFGGMRCPSEVLRVKWEDINWASNRLLVHSPKTEQHVGKAERMIPLFPELREVLMEAYELAPEGSVYVVGRYRDTTANLGTQFKRIIHRAGVTPWPRLFNAMRASRVTELAAEYPAAICTLWMGHTQAIAEAHYQMVRDEDYERAAGTRTIGPDSKQGNNSVAECVADGAQNASQQQPAITGNEFQNRAQNQKGSAVMPILAGRCDSLQNALNGPGQT